MNPKATKRAKAIFQEAWKIENMNAKLGKTLFKEENDLRKFILTQVPVLGRIPTIVEIGKAFAPFPEEKMSAILNKLDQLDVIHLNTDKSAIDAAYPFSGNETVHSVMIKKEGYKKVYGMCAIDVLGVPFMFDCDASIHSRCHHCEEQIHLQIEDNEIMFCKPEDTLVWCDMEYSCCAAASICKNINFFSSRQHFEDWQKEIPKRKGFLLELPEAFYLGKMFFEDRLKE
jgi:hypothetical protein